MSLTAYIKGHCDAARTYAKGVKYYEEGRVRITADSPCLGSSRLVVATVRGSSGNQYKTNIQISPDGNTLLSYGCSCPAYRQYIGLCKHVVALGLAVDAQRPWMVQAPEPVTEPMPEPKAPRAKTDPEAALLLRRYAQSVMAEAGAMASPTGTVSLVPVLRLSPGHIPVSFRLGIDRSYLLKDIPSFITALAQGATLSYGKQLAFPHTPSAFTPESRPLVQFLRTYYTTRNSVYADRYCYLSSSEASRTMYLAPFMLDALMELYRGRQLEVNDGITTELYTVREENPQLALLLNKLKSGNFRLGISEDFSLLGGSRRIYLAMGRDIFFCDEAYSQATRALFEALSRGRKQRLGVAEEDLKALTATLLPQLSPYLTVQSDQDLTAYIPPPLQSKVYLDMPTPELVTVRLEHCYGSACHPGFREKALGSSLDLKGEVRLETLLRHYFPSDYPGGQRCIDGDEGAIFELVDTGLAELGQQAQLFLSEDFDKLRIKPPAAVTVGVRVESDLLRLSFDLQGVALSELEELLGSYRRAKKYHRLRDGSFISLADNALSELSGLAQSLNLSARDMVSGEVSVSKYRALHLDALLKASERIQYDRDNDFKRIVRDVHNVGDADYKIPPSLRGVLRNYQKTGYRWMRTIAAYGFGGILADDMGLGKTLQVIALLLARKEEQGDHALSLVAAPSSLVLNWESEVQKFAPSLVVVPIVGTAPEREALILENCRTADLFLTSYDLLKRDIQRYASLSFAYVIADEAQYMKNQNTQNAKAVKVLQAGARLALTGTPVENSLAEVWSVFDFLMPGYLYSYGQFRKRFELPIVKNADKAAAQSLRQMVAPFILRRMKADVLKELPDKIETVLYAELAEEQRKLYLANAALARQELTEGLGSSGSDKLQILALITRLRQLCCDPRLVYENYNDGSAKLELCLELLQSCISSGHRVLLFSQFTSMLARIAPRLEGLGIPYLTITGQTGVSGRLELVNSFNSGTVPVFLISLKAGGTGLNLTGADVVIHYDPWWNSSAQNQATDRAHRIGQTKTVQVYKLIAKGTIEERILEMQQSKSDLADMIVRDGDGGFARMSREEILGLFQ